MRQSRGRPGRAAKPARPRSGASSGRSRGGGRLDAVLRSPWSALPLFLLALAIRLIHLDQMNGYDWFRTPVVDESFQLAWARLIASGQAPARIFFHDPGYAHVLAGLVRGLPVDADLIRTLQAFLGAAGAVLVQRLGISLLGPASGLFCGLLAAGYRPAIHHGAHLLEPVLVMLLVTLSLWGASAALKKPGPWPALVSGLALGAAALAQGTLLPLVPVALATFTFTGKMKRTAKSFLLTAFIVGLAVVLAPVALRNARVGGSWILTTASLGPELFIGQHAENPRGVRLLPGFAPDDPAGLEEAFRAEAERRTGSRLAPAPLSGYWQSRAAEAVAEDPWGALARLGSKAWLLANGNESPGPFSFDWEAERSWMLRLPFPGWALLFPLAVAGALAALGDRKAAGLRFTALAGLVMLAAILPFGVTSRLRLAVVPALLPLAVFGVSTLWKRLRAGDWREAAGLLAVVLVMGILVRLPVGSLPVARLAPGTPPPVSSIRR